MHIKIENTKIDLLTLKKLLYQGITGVKDSKEQFKEIIEGLFPHNDIEREVKEQLIYEEIKHMSKNYKFISLEDYDDTGDCFVAYFYIKEATDYLKISSYLREFSQYLANKYDLHINFEYTMNDYSVPKTENKNEVTEKPKPVQAFDIVIDQPATA